MSVNCTCSSEEFDPGEWGCDKCEACSAIFPKIIRTQRLLKMYTLLPFKKRYGSYEFEWEPNFPNSKESPNFPLLVLYVYDGTDQLEHAGQVINAPCEYLYEVSNLLNTFLNDAGVPLD